MDRVRAYNDHGCAYNDRELTKVTAPLLRESAINSITTLIIGLQNFRQDMCNLQEMIGVAKLRDSEITDVVLGVPQACHE